MAKYVLDEKLHPYATDEQWRKLRALAEHGSAKGAARALGITPQSFQEGVKAVKKKAAQQGYAPECGINHPIPEGLTSRGPSILTDASGRIVQYWNKMKAAGRPDEETTHVPNPKIIARVATLYDHQGKVTQQWVTEKPEDKTKEVLWQAFAAGLMSELPQVKPTRAPKHANSSLLACYPVGDHHFGMLSWRAETGADYDLGIAEKLLNDATAHLIGSVPPCETSLIALLGDFLHYDGLEAKTPTSGHILDADSRYPKMIAVALRSIRNMVRLALGRHGKVHIIIEIGNHDLSTSIFLAQCLAMIYENEPRVTVDVSPAHFHYFEFGLNLIGTHHGHGVKMEQLPLIMATDRREAWGRTTHRTWWTGHIHHAKSKSVVSNSEDYVGCTVESFRVLAPTDAWAAQKGYRSIRDMCAIVLHKNYGEVARHKVNPSMLEDAS